MEIRLGERPRVSLTQRRAPRFLQIEGGSENAPQNDGSNGPLSTCAMDSPDALPTLESPRSPSAQTEKQKLSLGLVPFGQEAPYFTISGAHAEIWHPLDTPSPDAYSLPPASTPRSHVIQGGPPTWPPHPTANVDLFDERVFQWRQPLTTDPKPRPVAPPRQDALGPNFLPATALSPRVIRIRSFFPPLRFQTVTPGPGTYAVNDGHTGLRYTIGVSQPRDQWLYRDIAYSPHPWHYSPVAAPCSPREPSWTIGSKSRRRRQWGKRVEVPKQRTIVVGPVSVRVNEEDYEYALRMIQDDIELKKMFTMVIDLVLDEKPVAPLAVVRSVFRKLKETVND
jgi:hypothetical protein